MGYNFPEACVQLLGRTSNVTTDVNPTVNYLFAGLSVFCFLVLTCILIIMHWTNAKIISTQTSIGVLFFAGLVTVVADISLDNSAVFRNIYIVVLVLVFGTFVNVYGSTVFFRTAQGDHAALGFGTSSVSVIIFAITIPLVTMEMFAGISAMLADDQWHATEWVVTLLQKAIQAGIYHFSIQHKAPDGRRTREASWYLKIISLFNFSMWIASICERDCEMLRYINRLMPRGLGRVLAAVYAALVIDYRLLCCLLFAELAVQVENWGTHITEIERYRDRTHAALRNTNRFLVAGRSYKGVGYMLGVIIAAVQLLNASVYFHKGKAVAPSVNFVGIFADMMIIVQGYIFICMSQGADDQHAALDSKAVEIMVGLMGVSGLAYCILRFALSIMAESSPMIVEPLIHGYFQWISVKFFIRIIGILSQLVCFFRLSSPLGHQRIIRSRKICHFLVPSIMLCQLSVFINSVIDSYSYRLEEFVSEVHLNGPAAAVYGIGEPFHLGFCLHMFFHFLNLNNSLNLQEQPNHVVDGGNEDDGEDDGQGLIQNAGD